MIRTSSGIELTQSGQCFYEKVCKILSDYRDMKNDILHIEQRDAGVIDLISAYGILRLLTPECIRQFCQSYPEIEFTYREYPDREVERKFQKKMAMWRFPSGLLKKGCTTRQSWPAVRCGFWCIEAIRWQSGRPYPLGISRRAAFYRKQ